MAYHLVVIHPFAYDGKSYKHGDTITEEAIIEALLACHLGRNCNKVIAK